jgi:hypothetical protein
MSVLFCDVIRKPKSEYSNFNYVPPKSVYGFCTFLSQGYVLSSALIEFPSQSFDSIADISGQNLVAIKCAYEGLLQSFVNQNQALGLVVTSVIDSIKDYEYLDTGWDEVKVKCYADTALKLRLYSLPFDKCKDDADPPRKRPKPPPPPETFPPGTPIEVDPPYDEDPELPDNDTEPYPGDEAPPPTEGEVCQYYTFTFQFVLRGGQNHTEVVRLYGDYGEYGLGGEGTTADGQFTGFSNAWIMCRGGEGSAAPVAPTCLPELTQCYFYGGPAPFIVSVNLVNVVPS